MNHLKLGLYIPIQLGNVVARGLDISSAPGIFTQGKNSRGKHAFYFYILAFGLHLAYGWPSPPGTRWSIASVLTRPG